LTAVRGVVFDLDGTLVDNMALHAEAFAAFLERHRLPALTTEMRARLDGQRNRDIFPIIFGRPLSEDDLRLYAGEKEGLYRAGSGGRLAPLRGLGALLDQLDALGIPTAVATSAPADNVGHTLRELGLAERLTAVVRSDQVPRGKPHPDVFLAAARLIGADPGACLAFEDAPAGLRAARAAGMRCVAVTTSFTREAFIAHGAEPDWAVADFEEFLAGPGRELLDGGGSNSSRNES
jgi:HAD superfamily hydrolase (TIGR01509 family)